MIRVSVLTVAAFGLASLVGPASADRNCLTEDELAQLISEEAEADGYADTEFRITRQEDGQALLYWDHGGDTRSFYAVTIRANGCAVLTAKGNPRRFVFPKSAYNSGVFYEMDEFDPAG